MFMYLSKKISIPNNTPVCCLAWENTSSWVACGGENALLKVLRLQDSNTTTGGATPAAPTGPPAATSGGSVQQAPASLSLSQSLEGHSGSVVKVAWNDAHTKLTTADSNGMIIVWVLYKGMWYEEMVNDRAKSRVADLKWTRNGDKIAIAYADGNIILGGVEGNRLLGKDLELPLTHVAWSPDAAFLLFATSDGVVRLFDAQANYQHKVGLYAGEKAIVTGLEWFAWSTRFGIGPDVPNLAISFDNGKVQLNRHERDPRPIIIDTSMTGITARWSPQGTHLAVGGHQMLKDNKTGTEKPTIVVQLYTAMGQYGKTLTSLSWDSSGLRLALGIDASIFFCNVHPDYEAVCTRTAVCYAHPVAAAFGRGLAKHESTKVVLAEYGKSSASNARQVDIQVPGLRMLSTNGEHVGIVSERRRSGADTANGDQLETIASVVNSVGTPLDTRSLGTWIKPTASCMTANYLVVTDGMHVVYFPYQLTGTASVLSAMLWQRESLTKMVRVGEGGISNASDVGGSEAAALAKDPIVAMACTDDWLVVAQTSGHFTKYAFPGMTRVCSGAVAGIKPFRIGVNADASVVSVIDLAGVLRLIAMPGPSSAPGNAPPNGSSTAVEKPQLLDVERKDVWNVTWSDDNRDMYAIMEKSRMYVMRGGNPEEPIAMQGYLSGFHDLELTVVDLDTLIASSQGSSSSISTATAPTASVVKHISTRTLRDTQSILSQVGLNDALSFVETHPHPKLWRLVSDAALELGEWQVAQVCLARLMDYAGLQWLKQIMSWGGSTPDAAAKQRAAVAAYLGNVSAAEQIYLEMDRHDLAVDLRMSVGDATRVVQLGGKGPGAGVDDAKMEQCWSMLGRECLAQRKYRQAATYLAQARDFEALAECHFLAEDVNALDALARALPVTATATLDKVGEYLARLGMAKEATYALTKRGAHVKAMAVCLALNQWNLAVELAGSMPAGSTPGVSVDASFARIESQLLSLGDGTQLVALYRSANQSLKAANVLLEAAKSASKAGKVDPVRLKKMFVLGALEVERYHALHGAGVTLNEDTPSDGLRDAPGGVFGSAGGNSTNILSEDAAIKGSEGKSLEVPWRGAEAYHYYLLSQRQFYMGDAESALRTAMVLRGYDDVLTTKTVYSLIALLAYKSRNYQVCSRALGKLQAVAMDEQDKATYEQIAIDIFTNHPVTDLNNRAQVPCTNCNGLMGELYVQLIPDPLTQQRAEFASNCRVGTTHAGNAIPFILSARPAAGSLAT
ncbi:hypothetical protein BCR44DRAFT_1498264 [Catenaria anguillulae PL171]|uniref:Anaphase-promoting complex subunit 4 WD40 domain-containing protein n=1 Tax=Catenaria anguillulae PL171 TaxID=765915 RepID=A0A1Y2HUD8_9FUNG|nr:hypothetical protein BCR44DRAFT_1498264 [Catenaria anguillulae PL171]